MSDDKREKCVGCDTGFDFDSCPMNGDREGYEVPKWAMHKHGLCFTMTEEEREQVMMSSLHRSCR